jgi:hypothetical protein
MNPLGKQNDGRRERSRLSLIRNSGSSRDIEHAISWNRREFLRMSGGATAAALL